MAKYEQHYFDEGIFSTDYLSLAKVINEKYQPKHVVEVGCGPGHLTRCLAEFDIQVTAIDGFSSPDFGNYTQIAFSKVNLDEESEIEVFLEKNSTFDIAICTEVGEHLRPESSAFLVKFLARLAPIVIFSAAVPNQGGNGHINCQNRGFWHQLFLKQDFILRDSLRKILIKNENLAIWYRLNTLDYIRRDHVKTNDEYYQQVIQNLLENESNANSLYYEQADETKKLNNYLNYPAVKLYFRFRRLIKRLIK